MSPIRPEKPEDIEAREICTAPTCDLETRAVCQFREGQDPQPGKCRICGCTDDRACPGGCSWIEADLCSACTAKAELIKRIDGMSQYELCRKWRFAITGDPMVQGEVGEYFAAKLREKGGFTPEISKDLGWER